jgi:twinkle protein
MIKKPYLTANDLQPITDTLIEKGIDIGLGVGFAAISDLYRVKRGCTTYIGGIPSHGKSEFHMELLLNLTEFYGFKHLIFAPETGSPAEIVAELTHKLTGKSYLSQYNNKISTQEKYKADAYLSNYFYIANTDAQDVTLDDVLKMAEEAKDTEGLDTFSIDPWNELSHKFDKHGGREDKYLEYALGKIRRVARKLHVHAFVIAHPRTLQQQADGTYKPPTAFELSGGAAWYAKAETIICVNRPSIETNEADIIIQKAKPKHIGKKGQCRLYFDYQRSRYYEHIAGQRQYATNPKKETKQQQKLTPNEQFINQREDIIPF